MARIFIKTYGCTMNQHESEIIRGILKKNGHSFTNRLEDAGLIVLNTCMVKSPTENKILSLLTSLVKTHPEKKIIIAGCIPEVIPGRLEELAPNASLMGTHALLQISDAVERTLEGEKIIQIHSKKRSKLGQAKIRSNPFICIIPISEGCQGSCTYCCVRIAKGHLFNYPPEEILDEARQGVQSGCKEIWLTAQDTASYQHEKNRLPNLLNEITSINDDFYIRVGMMNPNSCMKILPDLIKSYESEKIYKFLHLPLQSGNDDILSQMNRNYTPREFIGIIKQFRSRFPLMTIATDVIVGFPNETEKQFEDTLRVLEAIKPDIVNISKFGGRPRTKAKDMPNQINSIEIKKRSRACTTLVDKITMERNKAWINWEGSILVTEAGKDDSWLGRNFAYKSVIIHEDSDLSGKKINVRISEIRKSHLIGLRT
ncbi:MAG: tRNA (N(6)-L-threonylcarbamoyladenosine(37)-C(2))-methylthiotransferase [Candidatus Helarchaeota archaeon]